MRWTAEADEILRQVYPTLGAAEARDEIARQLGARTTPSAVRNRASILGLRRERKSRDRAAASMRIIAEEASVVKILAALDAADGIEVGRVSTYPARGDGKVRIYIDMMVE